MDQEKVFGEILNRKEPYHFILLFCSEMDQEKVSGEVLERTKSLFRL